MVGALWSEGHAAGDLGVGPNLSLEGFNGEDLILEEHGVVIDGLLDGLVFSCQGGHRPILTANLKIVEVLTFAGSSLA